MGCWVDGRMDGQRDNTTVDVIIAALLPYRILDNGLDMQRGRVSVQRIGRRIKAGRQFDMGLGVIQDIFLQKKQVRIHGIISWVPLIAQF